MAENTSGGWVDEGHQSWRRLSAYAWHPVRTLDAGWIWLQSYWRWQCVWGWGFFDDYAYVSKASHRVAEPSGVSRDNKGE